MKLSGNQANSAVENKVFFTLFLYQLFFQNPLRAAMPDAGKVLERVTENNRYLLIIIDNY